MTVVDGIDGLDEALGRLLVVVGVFDGLHLGHAYLLRELQRAALAHDARPAVITFDHHPDEVLTGSAPPLLCDPDERLHLLGGSGVVVTVVQTFDVALRETPYDAFVRRIAGRVDLAGFLMTPDSAFGFQRAGTPDTVTALGRELGYDVVVVPAFSLDGQAVSSSDVRRAIAVGDIDQAARLLGRPVTLSGLARRDGATATSLEMPLPIALPPDGTYPARIDGGARRHDEVVVQGGRPSIRPPVDVPDGTRIVARLTRADR